MHGTIMLTNRRGKKRKFRGYRPGAREVVVVELNPRTIAAAMPHRRALTAVRVAGKKELQDVSFDQKAVSELGRMCLFGRISDDMERAAGMFVGHYGSYMATAEGPHSGAGSGRGFDCRGDLACDNCECARRKANYLGALRALQTAGSVAVKAVSLVALHDRVCPQKWLRPLDWGLAALVKHYGLGGKSPTNRG